MEEKTLVCAYCGHELEEANAYWLGDLVMCDHCYGDNVVTCEHCGTEILRDEDCGDADIVLCESCRDDYYVRCDDCDDLIHIDNAYERNGIMYCASCMENMLEYDGHPIHEYDYKPDPIFYGNGPLYYGVELEIDNAGEYNSSAEKILKVVNQDAWYMYIKHDGSLNSGMELVTHPMSLQFHKTEMPWQKVTKAALKLGYRSHDTGTCGLHIHVSREALGETYNEQEEVISRVLYFVEHHWNELVKFSRRTVQQIHEWAERYGYQSTPAYILNTAKQGGGRRHTCVNITNEDTIEFRIFRGTLKYNTIIATLELVDYIIRVARHLADRKLQDLSWSDFVARIDPVKSPELVTYLKERRLYVNDEVTVTEEDV